MSSAPPPFDRPELLRRAVHLAVGAIAYLLPVLGWGTTFALTCAAVVANTFVLPRLPGVRIVRDVARGDRGIRLYPVGIAILLLVFRDRPWIAQAGWLALGFGDGMVPIAARVLRGGPHWPGRPEKRVGPSLAGGMCAALAVLPIVPAAGFSSMAVAGGAGLVACLADGLPRRIEDNLAWSFLGAVGAWTAGRALL